MTLRNPLLLGALLPLLAGCPKNGNPTPPAAPASEAAAPAKGAANGAGRLPADHVVAKWNGKTLTYGELREKRSSVFRKLENDYKTNVYQAEQKETEGYVLDLLLKEAASKAGKSEEEYLRGIAGTPQITEAEINEFYEKNVKQSGQPLAAVKPRIQQFLTGQKQQEAVRTEVERMKKEASVEISIPPPEQDQVKFELAGRPMKGKPDAKITIVEFSDFECPYCSKAVPGVEAILAAYPDDVKVYFLHFPLSFHKKAMPAAIAAHCANSQGKFWEFHDKVFENQSQLSREDLAKHATAVGIDAAKFSTCMDDPKSKALVESDMKQAEEAGVQGTPSFFIDGVFYPNGVPTVDAVKAFIDKAS